MKGLKSSSVKEGQAAMELLIPWRFVVGLAVVDEKPSAAKPVGFEGATVLQQ
jgi:hypothetical protein